eukprot:11860263-Alexandrium_andersonii.AAC.1
MKLACSALAREAEAATARVIVARRARFKDRIRGRGGINVAYRALHPPRADPIADLSNSSGGVAVLPAE